MKVIKERKFYEIHFEIERNSQSEFRLSKTITELFNKVKSRKIILVRISDRIFDEKWKYSPLRDNFWWKIKNQKIHITLDSDELELIYQRFVLAESRKKKLEKIVIDE